MKERLAQQDVCKVPNLLRTLMYANAKNCTFSTFFLQFQPSKGDITNYYIARVSTKNQVLTEPGFFIISLDFIKPTSPEVNPETIIEKVKGPAPLLPYFRLNESRLNGDHIINTYEIDDVFEPSAMAIHQRLIKEIIDLKRQSDIKEFERLSKLLRELIT